MIDISLSLAEKEEEKKKEEFNIPVEIFKDSNDREDFSIRVESLSVASSLLLTLQFRKLVERRSLWVVVIFHSHFPRDRGSILRVLKITSYLRATKNSPTVLFNVSAT